MIQSYEGSALPRTKEESPRAAQFLETTMNYSDRDLVALLMEALRKYDDADLVKLLQDIEHLEATGHWTHSVSEFVNRAKMIADADRLLARMEAA